MARTDLCDVYGCLRAREEPDVVVEVLIEEESKDILVCEYHKDFFQTTTPDLYYVGLTYRGQVEVRPHPAIPAE